MHLSGGSRRCSLSLLWIFVRAEDSGVSKKRGGGGSEEGGQGGICRVYWEEKEQKKDLSNIWSKRRGGVCVIASEGCLSTAICLLQVWLQPPSDHLLSDAAVSLFCSRAGDESGLRGSTQSPVQVQPKGGGGQVILTWVWCRGALLHKKRDGGREQAG